LKANLFIVGACKSGTSYLHDYLGNQKDVCASSPKEPYFFELPKEYRNEDDYINKYFSGYKSEKYLLDSRHRNMFFSYIPNEINKYNKEAKIIFILRNPIDRAFSHWWMWYSRKIISTNFHKAIVEEIKKNKNGEFTMNLNSESYYHYIKNKAPKGRITYADANTLVESGLYYQQIKRYFNFFDKEQILILNFKDLKSVNLINNELSNFLRIDFKNNIEFNKINKAPFYKKNLRLPFSFLIPQRIKKAIKNLFFKKPKIKNKTYKLLFDFYKPENEKLIKEFKLNFVKDWI